jgi:hypothetical protein
MADEAPFSRSSADRQMERGPQLGGQALHGVDEGIADRLAVAAGGQMHEHHEAGDAFHERPDRRAVVFADDQGPLPSGRTLPNRRLRLGGSYLHDGIEPKPSLGREFVSTGVELIADKPTPGLVLSSYSRPWTSRPPRRRTS